MAEFIIKMVEYVEKKLGKVMARILTGLILLAGTVGGGLWVIVFAVDKIDWLTNRFHLQLLPTTIQVISLAALWNAVANIIILFVTFALLFLVAMMPFLLLGYFVIDMTQRGKAEYLVKSATMILSQVQSQIPSEYAGEYENIIHKLEQLRPKNSWFRMVQDTFGRRVKPIKTKGEAKK